MSDLRERVDGLLDDVTTRIGADPTAAWHAGRRRRRTRAAGYVGLAAVLVAGLAWVVARPTPEPVQPAGSGKRAPVSSYPERIAKPYRTADVTDSDGPLAGFLESSGTNGLYGVSESGALYHLPQGDTTGGFQAHVSNDGTKVAYLQDATTFVVVDLPTGEVVEYDGIGDNRSTSREPHMTQGQAPGFWSPDDRHLLIYGWPNPDGPTRAGFLLLDTSGGYDELLRPPVAGRRDFANPVGWADPDHILWLQTVHAPGARVRLGPARSLELVTTDLVGEVVDRVALDVPRSGLDELNQWSGTSSPSGRQVYLTAGEASYMLDVDTGARTGTYSAVGRSTCLPSWQGETVLEPSLGDDVSATLVDVTDRSRAVTVAESSLDVQCLQLVPRALDGGASWTPVAAVFGTSSWWLGWHVTETLAVIGVLGALLVWRRRRRISD